MQNNFKCVVATELDCTGFFFWAAAIQDAPPPLRRSTTTPSIGPVDAGEKGVGPDVVHAAGARPQSLQRVVLEQLRRKGDGEIFSEFDKNEKQKHKIRMNLKTTQK